jgi:hypothetical protein
MTRGDLQNLVLYWLDDLNAGYFTPVQVNAWLNNAQIEVQKQLIQGGELWYNKCATFETIANTDCYSLPADFLKVNRLETMVQGQTVPNQVWGDILPVTLNEASNLNYGSGQPSVFTVGKDCLYLKPIPDNVYTIRMNYSYRVTPMTDDLNVPDVPPEFQEYIAVMAAMDGFLKDERNPSNLMTKMGYYKDMMTKNEIQRQRMKPRRVTMTTDDSGGFNL